MKDSKYVIVYLSSDDLYADVYEDYDEALEFVQQNEQKAYIIKFENFCVDGGWPDITFEAHT